MTKLQALFDTFVSFFRNPEKRELNIDEILSNPTAREQILGIDRTPPKTDAQNKSDAARLVTYSKSEDYAVFANELWEQSISIIKALSDENLELERVDFLRGSLSSVLDALKISYRAKEYLEKENSVPIHTNGYKR